MLNISRKTLITILICLCVASFLLAVLILRLPGSSSDEAATSAPPTTALQPSAKAGESSPKEHAIYIETGHGVEDNGNWDAGCSWTDGGTRYEEAQIMIPIARAMASYLRQAGVTVYTDADEDNNLNLAYTLDFLDEHPEIDAFVNLHCDYEDADSGTLPLYRTEEQRELAQALNDGVHARIDIPDRGLTYRDDLDTLTSDQVHCPAVLFETGSIREDNEILTQQYDEYGRGLAEGLCDYLNSR